jgi:hypothetical protein
VTIKAVTIKAVTNKAVTIKAVAEAPRGLWLPESNVHCKWATQCIDCRYAEKQLMMLSAADHRTPTTTTTSRTTPHAALYSKLIHLPEQHYSEERSLYGRKIDGPAEVINQYDHFGRPCRGYPLPSIAHSNAGGKGVVPAGNFLGV